MLQVIESDRGGIGGTNATHGKVVRPEPGDRKIPHGQGRANIDFDGIVKIQIQNLVVVAQIKTVQTGYHYDGGMDTDTIDFRYSSEAVNVLLKQHTFGDISGATGGFAQNARFQNIENIVGTDYKDTLGGDDSVNDIQDAGVLYKGQHETGA